MKNPNIPGSPLVSHSERTHKNNAIINTGLDINAINKQQKEDNKYINSGSILAKWIRRFSNNKKYQQQTGRLYKRYNSQQFDHTTIEHLGYKGLTKDDPATGYFDKNRHYLILADDMFNTSGYAEMIKIGGASLSDLPLSLIYRRMGMFYNFLNAFTANVKFISLPLPNDSRIQRHQWQSVYDSIHQRLLSPNLTKRQRAQLLSRSQRIKELISIFLQNDRELINQGFVMMVFDNTIRKLDEDVRQAYTIGQGALNLEPMSPQQKEQFLRHLNNPNETQTM